MINSLIRLLFLNWIYNTTVEPLTRTHFSVVVVLPHPSIFENVFECLSLFFFFGERDKNCHTVKIGCVLLVFLLAVVVVFFYISLAVLCIHIRQFPVSYRNKKKKKIIKINGIFSFEKYKKGANRKKVFLSPTRKCNPRYGDTWDNTHGKKKTSLEAEAEMCVFLLITHQEIYIYIKKEKKKLKKEEEIKFHVKGRWVIVVWW